MSEQRLPQPLPQSEPQLPHGAREALEQWAKIWPDDPAGQAAFAAIQRILRHSGEYDALRRRVVWTDACDSDARTLAISYALSRLGDPDFGTQAVNTVLKHVAPAAQKHQIEFGPAKNEVDDKLTRILIAKGVSEEDARLMVASAAARDFSLLLGRPEGVAALKESLGQEQDG